MICVLWKADREDAGTISGTAMGSAVGAHGQEQNSRLKANHHQTSIAAQPNEQC